MKVRPDGFLDCNHIDHDGEIFDYIRELHIYLWQYINKIIPGASGYLNDYVDLGLNVLDDYNNILLEYEKELETIKRLQSGL